MGAKLASLSGVLGATQDRGLTFITSSTFSAASSVSVDGCFTSAYDNYLILADTDVSTSAATTFRLRVSAADNSTANYRLAGFYEDWNTIVTGEASTGQTSWHLGTNSGRVTHAFVIHAPQLAAKTRAAFDTTGDTRVVRCLASFDATTQFDGLTLARGSGTFTGSLYVYGYRSS